MYKVAIIIPNWNGADKLKVHLPNVLRAAQHSKVNEVIVSDDNSSDNSVEILKKEFPEVKVVERKINGGFSSNVNFGASHTNADLIVLLNSDASPRKDFLDSLIPHFQESKIFSVGSNTGGSWARAEFKNGFFWHSQAEIIPTFAHRSLWVSGGSGIFRKSIWDELGGLDTLFDPFYEEDLDLGYRATKRGYINLWEPKSIVEHHHEEGVISKNFKKSRIEKIAQRNQLIFIWKNITSQDLFNDHRKALVKKLAFHPKYWNVFLAAFVKLSEIQKKRAIEKKQAKLSDEEILELFKID